MKILTSNPPSYIRAEFGSLASMSPDNSKGEVEISIVKRNGGSYVNLNFSFSLEYLAAFYSHNHRSTHSIHHLYNA